MLKTLRRRLTQPRDESGVEAAAMIIVIPCLVVLIFGLIAVGQMFSTRLTVQGIARDTVRQVAIQGGDLNPHLNQGASWSSRAQKQLSSDGKCKLSACKPGKVPNIDCTYITPPGDTPPSVGDLNPAGTTHAETVPDAGWTVTCVVTYPYQPPASALLNEPVIGMGMGMIVKPFTIVESARAETGCSSC